MVVVDYRSDGTYTVVHNDHDKFESLDAPAAVDTAQKWVSACPTKPCELFFTYDAVSALLMQVRGMRPGVRWSDLAR